MNDETTPETLNITKPCSICQQVVGKYAHEDDGGIVCHSCNTGLGAFKNSVNLLGLAIKYLQSVTRIDKPMSRRKVKKIKVGDTSAKPKTRIGGGKGDSVKWHEERYKIEDDAKARYEKLGNLLGWDNVTARQVWDDWIIRYNSKGMID